MSFALLLHWIMNDNKCILTEIECYFMETTDDKTLTRQLLAPLLNQSSDLVVVGTLLGLILSVFKLYWFLCLSRAQHPMIVDEEIHPCWYNYVVEKNLTTL